MSKSDKAAAAATSETPAAPAPFIAASESRFAPSAEFTFPLASYIPQAGTPLDYLKEPRYWANIKGLKPGVRIWAVPEDDKWWAELYVRKVGQGFAVVQILRDGVLDPIVQTAEIDDGYEVEHKGSITRWRIVRKADSRVLKDKLDSEEAARSWLKDYKRMIAA